MLQKLYTTLLEFFLKRIKWDYVAVYIDGEKQQIGLTKQPIRRILMINRLQVDNGAG